MRIGFLVNDIRSEVPTYTTVRLAMAAENLDHEAWLLGVGDFALDSDDRVRGRARRAAKKDQPFSSCETYLSELQGKEAAVDRITVGDLDVLMLRNDPSADMDLRAWAQTSGITFGRLAMRHGVIVLNDPNGLARALNKTYLQLFPEEVRPRTLITRDRDEIRDFARENEGSIVLKPLLGSGGRGVFLVRPDDLPNLNQMVEAVSRDGYVIAQEYLPAAAEGDTRLFLMNGEPLRYRGRIAAFRRVRSGGDMRSNIRAGGRLKQAEIGESDLELAEIVRPKLVQDGMFLVGLDIVGDKLMEINVFSPGGLGSAQKLEKVDFTHAVIDALERKCEYMGHYHRDFDNVEMATL